MNYTGEEKGEEAGLTGSLDSSALSACSPLTPLPPPARHASAPPPAARPRSPVELLDTAEQEDLDALWKAAHFHD